MENQLIYIEDLLPRDFRAETTLKVVQFWHQNPMPPIPRLRKFRHSLRLMARTHSRDWRAATDALNAVEDKLEMFDRFATIDRLVRAS